MIPKSIMEEARVKAKELIIKPKNWIAAIVIVAVWTVIFLWIILTILHMSK